MRLFIWALVAGTLLPARGQEPAEVPAELPALPTNSPIAVVIATLSDRTPSEPVVFDALSRFYRARNFRPAWDGGRSAASRQFLDAVAGANAWGLSAKDYAPQGASPAPGTAAAEPTAEELARRDVAFSAGFLRLARDLRVGRAPPQPDPPGMQWQPAVPDLVPELEAALASGEFAAILAALEPSWPGYLELKAALERYRAIAAHGGWPAVPSIGRSMKIGTKNRAIAVLRRRLAIEGDLPARAAPREEEKPLPWHETFDGAVDTAVRQFQMRHALDVDGIAGPKSLAALNTPVAQRILQLRLNLERWRWADRQPPARALVVTLPLRELSAIENDQVALRMRLVHGPALPDLAGESFADKLEYLEFAPCWNVPYHIATGELLPKARQDPGWLAREGYEIVNDYNPEGVRRAPGDEAFAEIQEGRLFIRQRPGPANPLGQVRFMVPNYFAIFLHGREKDAAFEDTRRDLGRGWIRVEEPARLAAFVLAGEPGWSPDRVRKGMAAEQTQRVPLYHPLPFYLFQRTAVVDPNGKLLLWPDTDGRDARLAKATGFSAADL